jgi:hypothetical protein
MTALRCRVLTDGLSGDVRCRAATVLPQLGPVGQRFVELAGSPGPITVGPISHGEPVTTGIMLVN